MNLFRDFVYPLVGFGLLVTGATLIYRPAGFLVAGLLLLFLASVRPKTIK